MVVSAVLKNVRISEKKVYPVLNKIRGLSVEEAINILSFSNKKASFFVKKILKSVIANAEHNNGMDIDNLFIFRIYACSGTKLKRLNIRAKGRSDKIIKRSCHIFIKVKERQ